MCKYNKVKLIKLTDNLNVCILYFTMCVYNVYLDLNGVLDLCTKHTIIVEI